LKRIRYLDGLRGVAIALVLLYHVFNNTHPHWLVSRYGLMGVDLFFMISGFVILMTLEKCGSFGEFMGRRWLRLWPAMFIACVFALALYFAVLPLPDGASIFPGLTIIDDRWYSWAFGTNVKSLDGAYWTLYLEMRFYVLFGLIYFWLGSRAAICAIVGLSLIYLVLLSTGHGMGFWRWTDLRFEAWFAAGASFYMWTKQRNETWFVTALCCGLLAAWIYYPSHGPRLFGAALLVLFATCVRFNIGTLKPIVWLGAVSYPLYLIHDPLLLAFGPILGIAAALLFAHLIAYYAEPSVRATLSGAHRILKQPI
jgi:peptidoglycan/LPS O-acetylase OafA/YrhL